MKLIATYPILYQSRQYKVGEELPANNEEMVNAWTDAETAVWMEDQEPAPKANPVTAQAGLPGSSVGTESDDDNLVGVVPKTPARKKEK